MIEAIHQSTLNMALRCGEQFRRRYIEGDIIPPSIPAGRGTGVHKANEVNMKQKVESKVDLPTGDLTDAARDGYVHSLKNGVYIPKEEQSEKKKLLNIGLNDTIRCTEVYSVDVAPKIQPIDVEHPFDIDVGLPLRLAGRMDYTERPELGDLKSTSMKWPDGRAQAEIQRIFYSLAFEKTKGIRPDFTFHVLIARRNREGKPTSTDYQKITLRCTDRDYKVLFAKLRAFVNMLQKGVFLPANPTSWWCSAKWCGYYESCEYV